MRNVLLVEDDLDTLESLGLVLRLEIPEASITPVRSAQGALRYLRERPVDAILADHRLPDGTGLDLLREVRQLKPGLPTFLMTGSAEPNVARPAIEQGLALAFFPKPLDTDRLVRVLREALALGPHVRPLVAGRRRGFWTARR